MYIPNDDKEIEFDVNGVECRLSEDQARRVYHDLGRALARCIMNRVLGEGFKHAARNRVLDGGNNDREPE